MRGVRGRDMVRYGRQRVHRVWERGEFAGGQHGECRMHVPERLGQHKFVTIFNNV